MKPKLLKFFIHSLSVGPFAYVVTGIVEASRQQKPWWHPVQVCDHRGVDRHLIGVSLEENMIDGWRFVCFRNLYRRLFKSLGHLKKKICQ